MPFNIVLGTTSLSDVLKSKLNHDLWHDKTGPQKCHSMILFSGVPVIDYNNLLIIDRKSLSDKTIDYG